MYQIRLASTQDAEEIAGIYRPFVDETAISFESTPPTTAQMAERIEQALEKHSWWVCAYHDQVVGYAYAGALRTRAAYRFTAEASVYVSPQHHRKGIARALYQLLHNILLLQGFKTCYAGMTAPNPASKAFHESMGYLHMATYSNVGFKNGEWHSTEWFHKSLAPTQGAPEELLTLTELSPQRVEEAIAQASLLLQAS